MEAVEDDEAQGDVEEKHQDGEKGPVGQDGDESLGHWGEIHAALDEPETRKYINFCGHFYEKIISNRKLNHVEVSLQVITWEN